MSGRAGRRGFDTIGNVLFVGLKLDRIQYLMTSEPENLIGLLLLFYYIIILFYIT
jgi:superfamily II RNA helicase